MIAYLSHARGLVAPLHLVGQAVCAHVRLGRYGVPVGLADSVLDRATVYRCQLWPWGVVGEAPPPGLCTAAGASKRGPSNVLVLAEGRPFVVPRRMLRRVR